MDPGSSEIPDPLCYEIEDGKMLDCTTCGACCVYGGDVALYKEENVPKYLTRSVKGRMGYASDDHYDLRRMHRIPCDGDSEERCVALAGAVGHRCKCKIYDRRPAVCREYVPGSPECLESRRVAGLATSEESQAVACQTPELPHQEA